MKEELKPIDVTRFTVTENGNVIRNKIMTEKINLTFINEVISAIDSFQQDYGTFRYSITIQSYALHHQLTVDVVDTKSNNAIRFVIEQTLYEQAVIPSLYVYDLMRAKSEELASKE